MEEVKDNFTKIPNELLQALQRTTMGGTLYQVVLTVIRLTYGYPTQTNPIGYAKIMRFTGLSKDTVAKAVQRLLKFNILVREGEPTSRGHIMYVQPNYALWENYSPPPNSYKGVDTDKTTEYEKQPTDEYANSHTGEYALPHTQEKKRKKETIEKKIGKEVDLESSNGEPPSRQESISGLSQEELDAQLAERLKEAWNNGVSELNPKIMSLNPGTQRFRNVIMIWKYDKFREKYKKAIEIVEKSNYLSGRSGTWIANFDWFIKRENFDKIMEGNYKTLVKKDDDEGFIHGDDDIELRDADD